MTQAFRSAHPAHTSLPDGSMPVSSGKVGDARHTQRYRSLFLSDFHLYARACKHTEIHRLLSRVSADTVYLLGDIRDLKRLRDGRGRVRPADEAVERRLPDLVADGSLIYFVPGNHDDRYRQDPADAPAGMAVRDHCVHLGADGRRYLLIHGDEAQAGDGTYPAFALICAVHVVALTANDLLNAVVRFAGLKYVPLTTKLKRLARPVLGPLKMFERQTVDLARHYGCEGVICGHVHVPDRRTIDGISYMNSGDWVESCVALAETHDGRFVYVDSYGSMHT